MRGSFTLGLYGRLITVSEFSLSCGITNRPRSPSSPRSAALLLFFGITRAAGGIGSLSSVASRPEGAALFAWDAAMPFPVLLGIVMAGTLKFVVEPRQLSRFYALADRKALRRGMWMSTLAFLLVYSLLVPLGLYARSLIPVGITDTDLITPTLLSRGDVFNPAISSFLVVAMIAAAMSSLDSVLLVMASTFERDVIGLWRGARAEAITIRYTRVYVTLFALITALLAFNPPGGIVTLTAFSGSLFAACFLPAIVLGLHWRRGDGTAVILSFAIGIAVLLLWRFLPFATGLHAVFPAMLLSTVGYAAAASYSKPVEAREVAGLFLTR